METTGDEAEALSTHEAARIAGESHPTIAGWISVGYLPARRCGRVYCVRRGDLAVAQRAAHLDGVIPAWRANPKHTGRRLQHLRQDAGLTQGALAAAAGLTHEAISRLEGGRRTPYAVTVRKLAAALEVPPEQFVAREPIGLTMLDTTKTAARLDVPRDRLHRWLQTGEIARTKVSGRWRVPEIAVTELESSGRLRGQSRRLDPRYRG